MRWLIAGFVLSACQGAGEPVVLAETTYPPEPEAPAILRDVALIEDPGDGGAAYTVPFVPGHRTTVDGRVAVRVQGGPPGPPQIAHNISFYLFIPEKLDAPVLAGPPGPEILATPEPFDLPFPPATAPGVTRTGHHAICDPTEARVAAGGRANPYTCGPDGRHDCYDLTIVSSTAPLLGAQLWGTDVVIEVADPKTPQARIVRAERVGEPIAGIEIPITTEFMEPAVTRDGRLLTGRLGRAPRSWTHPETGEVFNRPYDLVYNVLPPDAEPCDITRWSAFHPMSHAPYDPDMIGRYGLAATPFRDTEGQPIPDGEDLGGTYPWVDREGANVFMTGVHGRVIEQSKEKYPRRCVVEGCEALTENTDWDRGFMVAGLWTHGKFVHLDGLINNQDWAVGVSPDTHYLVDLYRDAAGAPVPVRFGSGRFVQEVRERGGPYPPGYSHNANILDSLQQRLNHVSAMLPITPRDVVWLMGTGVATDEIAFDDFMDPNALIVSNMQASITQAYDEQGRSASVPIHHNGQVRTIDTRPSFLSEYPLIPEADADIHVQNAATSPGWNVPAYGFIPAGEARIEPVALGGIRGRGLWLSGDAGVRYDLPAQPRDPDGVEAYVGIYVDVRTPEAEARTLLTFPDGTSVVLWGASRVGYVTEGRAWHTVDLPPSDGWVHLAWRLDAGREGVTLLVDGLAFDRVETKQPRMSLGEGAFTVGRAAGAWTGFRGWIDDLVVLLHRPDVEVACNHAGGTLVEVVDDARWAAVAARYPAWAHAEVAAAAGRGEGVQVACYADHSDDHAAHLGNLPEGTRTLRAAIHFPEGPLRAGVPRPDSSGNAFCLSCHTAEGKGGLSIAALTPQPGLPAELDPRRQPIQPPPRVFGNIPAGWIAPGAGPGGPAEAMQAPPEGMLIDPWLLAGPEGAPPAGKAARVVHRH